MKKLILLNVLVMFSSYVNASDVTSINGLRIQMDNQNFTQHNNAAIRLSSPYCLEQGAENTELKYDSCKSDNSAQKFSYANNKVISFSGSCLARVNQNKVTSLVTTGGWTNAFSTTVAFTSCNDEDNNQKWQLLFTNNNYQLKALEENTCLTFEASVGEVHSYPGGAHSAHYAFVNLNSCKMNITQLIHGDAPIMVVEKYIPIIISM